MCLLFKQCNDSAFFNYLKHFLFICGHGFGREGVECILWPSLWHFLLHTCVSPPSVWLCQIKYRSEVTCLTLLESMASKWLINLCVVTVGRLLSVFASGCGLIRTPVWTIWQSWLADCSLVEWIILNVKLVRWRTSLTSFFFCAWMKAAFDQTHLTYFSVLGFFFPPLLKGCISSAFSVFLM